MATSTRFQQLEELYHELADLPGEERAPLLEATRRSDPEVYEELVRLLRREVDSEERALLGMVDRAQRPQAGDVVGPFRLARPLGEGGMGVVFDAQQESPVERHGVQPKG